MNRGECRDIINTDKRSVFIINVGEYFLCSLFEKFNNYASLSLTNSLISSFWQLSKKHF